MDSFVFVNVNVVCLNNYLQDIAQLVIRFRVLSDNENSNIYQLTIFLRNRIVNVVVCLVLIGVRGRYRDANHVQILVRVLLYHFWVQAGVGEVTKYKHGDVGENALGVIGSYLHIPISTHGDSANLVQYLGLNLGVSRYYLRRFNA